MMKVLPGLLAIAFSLTAQAQVAPPQATPKKDPFEGFGSALDKRPHSYHLATTPRPASAPSPSSTPAPAPTPVFTLPTAANGLSFEAKLVSNGGANKVKTNSTALSESRSETRESKTFVEYRARNFSPTPAEARMEWFFVARDVQTKKSYVWDQGHKSLSLPAGVEQAEVVESTELVRTSAKSSRTEIVRDLYGQAVRTTTTLTSSETGSRPYGWIVRMWAGDRLVQVRTSSNDLETLARTLGPIQ